jgi:hypothetical protein
MPAQKRGRFRLGSIKHSLRWLAVALVLFLSLYHFGYFSSADELEEATTQAPVEVAAVVEAPQGDTIEKPKVATPGAKPDGMLVQANSSLLALLIF